MTHTVTMTKEFSTTTDPALQPAPVTAVLIVTGFTGFADAGIFVFKKDQASGVWRYDHVATTADLANYNYNVPGDSNWVRRSRVDIEYLRADLAEEGADEIEAAVLVLCTDSDLLDEFSDPVTVTIP